MPPERPNNHQAEMLFPANSRSKKHPAGENEMRTNRIMCIINMISVIVILNADLTTAQGTTASLDAKTRALIAETALLKVEEAIRERASKPEVVAGIQRMMMAQGMADNLLQDKMQESIKPMIMEQIRPAMKNRIVDKVTPLPEAQPAGL